MEELGIRSRSRAVIIGVIVIIFVLSLLIKKVDMCKTLFKGTEGKWIYRVTSWIIEYLHLLQFSQENTDPFTSRNFQIVEALLDYNPFFVMKL
jgi:hypothetical protein